MSTAAGRLDDAPQPRTHRRRASGGAASCVWRRRERARADVEVPWYDHVPDERRRLETSPRRPLGQCGGDAPSNGDASDASAGAGRQRALEVREPLAREAGGPIESPARRAGRRQSLAGCPPRSRRRQASGVTGESTRSSSNRRARRVEMRYACPTQVTETCGACARGRALARGTRRAFGARGIEGAEADVAGTGPCARTSGSRENPERNS